MTDNSEMNSGADPNQPQGASVPGGQQVRIRIDERQMNTSYANAFRTNANAEEVFIDFGLNTVVAGTGGEGGEQPSGEILFQTGQRIILNHYTAKRLAITLGQIIRQHEQRFGELKLNVADRMQ